MTTSIPAGVPERLPDAELKKLDEELARTHVDGTRDYYALRRGWSRYLKWALSIAIAFQIILTFLVGFRILDFTQYEWFINAITAETFLQIVAMCLIVLKFLYPEKEAGTAIPKE